MLHIEELEIESNDSVSFLMHFYIQTQNPERYFLGGYCKTSNIIRLNVGYISYTIEPCPGQMKSIVSEIGGDIYMNAV